MSVEVFSEAMGLIGEKYIMEAATYQRKKHPLHKVWLSRVAGVLLAILLAGSAVLAFSTEARAAFLGWIRQQYETFYVYTFAGSIDNTEPVRYELGSIPEGFTFTTVFEIKGGESHVYIGPNGEIGEFGYSVAPDGIALYIEAAECEHRSVIINGLPGDLYLPKDRSSRTELLWVDDSTGTMFTLGFQVDPEVLISIAETIQVKSD